MPTIDDSQLTAFRSRFAWAIPCLVGIAACGGTPEQSPIGPPCLKPAIAQLSPSSAAAGSGDVIVDITGMFFTDQSSVLWNETSLDARYEDAMHLQVKVPAAFLASPGAAQIAVRTNCPSSNGFQVSESAAFTIVPPMTVAPFISALAPPEILATPDDVMVEILGGGFDESTKVTYCSGANGTCATIPTTFVSSSKVLATATGPDLGHGDGYAFHATVQGAGTNVVDLQVDDPRPTIIALEPPSAASGVGPLMLVVSGRDLTPPVELGLPATGALVQVDGVEHATTAIDDSHLAVELTTADLATPAILAITVVNPAPGPSLSSDAVDFVVGSPPLRIVTTELPDGTEGVPYALTLVAEGGRGSFQWSIASGALPGGLTLVPDGSILGTPFAAVASAPVTIRVSDGDTSAMRDFTMTVHPAVTHGVFVAVTHDDLGMAANPDVSQDGRLVAFVGTLVPGEAEVFVKDTGCRGACGPVQVSVDDDGNPGTGGGSGSRWRPRMTPDGRFVVFVSTAAFAKLDNLAGGTAAGRQQIYLRDRDVDGNGIFDEPNGLGVHDHTSTSLVTINRTGDGIGTCASAACAAGDPSISTDGRFVAFHTDFGDLDGNATPLGDDNVYYRDTCFGAAAPCTPFTGLVSRGSMGAPVATLPAISGDGQWIAYSAAAPDLVKGTTATNTYNLYGFDTCADPADRYCPSGGPGNRVIFSESAAGDPGADEPINVTLPALSGDGRFVAFATTATTLTTVAPSSPCKQVIGVGARLQVFVRDRDVDGDGRFDEANSAELFDKTVTCLASLDGTGNPGTDGSANGESLSMSADGRVVSFFTLAPNLIGLPTTSLNREQAVLRDTCANAGPGCVPATSLGSITADGALADRMLFAFGADPPRLSPDGTVVVFASDATNLSLPPPSGAKTNLYASRTGLSAPGPGAPGLGRVLRVRPSRAPGGKDRTLTIFGSGFSPSTIVTWNGLPLVTIYLGPHKLFARAPATILGSAGSAPIRACRAGDCTGAVLFTVDVAP